MEVRANLFIEPYPTGTIEPDELVLIRQQPGGFLWSRHE